MACVRTHPRARGGPRGTAGDRWGRGCRRRRRRQPVWLSATLMLAGDAHFRSWVPVPVPLSPRKPRKPTKDVRSRLRVDVVAARRDAGLGPWLGTGPRPSHCRRQDWGRAARRLACAAAGMGLCSPGRAHPAAPCLSWILYAHRLTEPRSFLHRTARPPVHPVCSSIRLSVSPSVHMAASAPHALRCLQPDHFGRRTRRTMSNKPRAAVPNVRPYACQMMLRAAHARGCDRRRAGSRAAPACYRYVHQYLSRGPAGAASEGRWSRERSRCAGCSAPDALRRPPRRRPRSVPEVTSRRVVGRPGTPPNARPCRERPDINLRFRAHIRGPERDPRRAAGQQRQARKTGARQGGDKGAPRPRNVATGPHHASMGQTNNVLRDRQVKEANVRGRGGRGRGGGRV